MSPSLQRGALAVVGLLALAGCTSDAPTATSRTAAPTLLASAELRMPLEEHLLTGADLDLVAAAEEKLTATCMARLGVPRWSRPQPPAGFHSLRMAERRYGITDDGEASQLGYRQSPETWWQPPVDQRVEVQLTGGRGGALEMQRTGNPVVFNGHRLPFGGCQGEARMTLSGAIGPIRPPALVATLSAESFGQSLRDPRVSEALGAWSACMADSGYTYQTPLEPLVEHEDALRELAAAKHLPIGVPFVTPPPSAEEIAIARADVACKQQTNLIGVWFTVETEIQKQLIVEHATELAEMKTAELLPLVGRARRAVTP